ncbi:hypothetical protein [Phaeocystidibacter luteus]|uniref:O-antigen ligase family protein n=1 Tax=Phaeocystidibacter luteus TaxID=911197 RepID=A0A6N6RJ87_9FLAO|nr:hypothetical protein [Phaeocystidibacter luteus]KAB2814332.1 hypothetical protein F8C67_00955 [Phaeocystidibacter luteus]
MIKLSKAVVWLYFMFVALVVGKQLPLGISEIVFNRGTQIIGLLLFVGLMRYNRLLGFLSKRAVRNINLGVFFAFLGSLLAGVFKGQTLNFLVIFNVLGFIGFGIYTAYFFRRKVFFKRLFYILSFYFVILIVNGVSIKVWLNGSYNHISVVTLFLVSMYYIEKDRSKDDKSIGLVPAGLTVVFCLVSTGRSAILSSGLLLALAYLHDYISPKRGARAVVIIAIALYLINAYLLDVILDYSEKFQEQGFTEEGRLIVFSQFLTDIGEWRSLFFGVNYNRLYEEQNLTIHNSYLSMHSRFGIVAIVFFVMTAKLIRRSYKYYKLGLVLLLPILLRSFTDTILISDGFLMGSLYFAIFFITNKKRNEAQQIDFAHA